MARVAHAGGRCRGDSGDITHLLFLGSPWGSLDGSKSSRYTAASPAKQGRHQLQAVARVYFSSYNNLI